MPAARRGATALAALLALPAALADPGRPPRRRLPAVPDATIVAGTFPGTEPQNAPADWPAAAGVWNSKAARLCPATRRIVFESHRDDIRGGSIAADDIRATGVGEYYVAGPDTGTSHESGTTVLYVAAANGGEPSCIGCADVVDGEQGIAIYSSQPSTSASPGTPERRAGAAVWANRNKDVPHWDPSGAWLLAAVEMPVHALTHASGKGEVGMFNDLWAISADGRTWVQLTDFAATWSHGDPVAPMPYACADAANCPTGCQYLGAGGAVHPFAAYSCSGAGAPPPASGVMRPIVSSAASGGVPGSAKVVWAERIGLSPAYVWGGVLQLATADLVLADGLPALVNYERNVTPTPAHPDGRGLWGNPGGATVIGAGYEPWSFSADDALIGLATDAFLSTSDPTVTQAVSPTSQAFTDAVTWQWGGIAFALTDVTRHDAVAYPYRDNGGPHPIAEYGHWEEPIVLSPAGFAVPFVLFASSADLRPPWNPSDSAATFALETWIMRSDRQAAARPLTHFSEPATAPRVWAYPTSIDAATRSVYLTVVPSVPGADPPGSVFRLTLPRL